MFDIFATWNLLHASCWGQQGLAEPLQGTHLLPIVLNTDSMLRPWSVSCRMRSSSVPWAYRRYTGMVAPLLPILWALHS